MKLFKMNSITKTTGRVAMISGLAVMLGTGSAIACSLENWSSTSSAMFASQPDGAGGDPTGAPASERYAGFCGATAQPGEFVQDNRPGGIDRIIARFYVLNEGATDPVVYRGNDSADNELFNVALSATEATLDAGGISVSDSIQAGWNSIEIDWDSAAGSIGIIVNGGAEVTANGISSASLANVQVGNLEASAGGNVLLDAYEAHLSTAVGRLLNADSNDNGSITSADLVATRNEILGVQLAPGTPDCNESGGVTTADIVCARTIILNP